MDSLLLNGLKGQADGLKVKLMLMSEIEIPAPDTESAQSDQDSVQPELDPRDLRIAELETQATQMRDGMLRAVADLQNFRKRAIAEAVSARETAASEIAAKLLPILDNFERTLEAVDSGASQESILTGIRLIEKQLRDTLQAHKVSPIHALGTEFDPSRHEAVALMESDQPPGTVLAEIEKGYTIGEQVLRPTKVTISKGQADG